MRRTTRMGTVGALCCVACTVLAIPARATVPADGPRATTISCAFTDESRTRVTCTVSNAPRTARLVLERRDGPKGTFKPVDSSHDLAAMLMDDDPPVLRPTYRVRVEAVRGQVMAQVVLSRY